MRQIFTLFKKPGIFLLLFISAAWPGVEGQASHEVDVSNYEFDPDEITIQEGDTVVWTNSEGSHNVNGSQSVFASNPESFGNDVGTGWVYSHVFTVAGTYDYQCDPHASLGMTGRVIVEGTAQNTLNVHFSAMNPHVGQMLTLYVRDMESGFYLDTVVVDEIMSADFSIASYVIEPGGSYLVDFYADLNQNGMYDAPPTDHAWRLETGETMGDVDLDFIHNTDFTDIFGTTGTETVSVEDGIILYPNPAIDQLNVNSGTLVEVITIFSVTGAPVKTVSDINSASYLLSLEGIGAGVYFVEVTTSGKEKRVGRLVIH